MASDIIKTLNPVVKVFHELNIAYGIGGSVASSAYGVGRSTMDIDLVCDIRDGHVEAFSQALSKEYYLDSSNIREAIERKVSFNLISLQTMMKIDIFVLKEREFDQGAFPRRVKKPLTDSNDSENYYFVSAEDILLNKLEWYRRGNEVSQNQWKDILGILKLQKDKLDQEYIQKWAKELCLDDLLSRALKEPET